MAVYTAPTQTIPPGETAIFNIVEQNPFGPIRHRDNTGTFILSGKSRCGCKDPVYIFDFGSNIAVSEGGTAGPISVAITIDGATVPDTTMISTPAAVGEFNNVSVAHELSVFSGCCETIAIRNTSDQSIDMQNGGLIINRKGA